MLEAEPAPLAARAQHRDVAAVGVDVHQLGIERADPQRRHIDHRAAEVVEGLGHRRAAPTGSRPAARASRLELLRASASRASLRGRRSLELARSATPPGAGARPRRRRRSTAHVDAAGSSRPSRRARACRGAAAGRPRPGSPSRRSASAAANGPPGARCACTRRSIAARPSGAAEDLHELHRRDHEREAAAELEARARRRATRRRAARARARRASSASSPASASSASPRGRAPRGRAPRGRCRRRGRGRAVRVRPPARARAAGRRRRSRSRRRARSRRRRSLRPPLREAALARAGRAARAAPCRWAARRRGSPAALADGGVERAPEVAVHRRARRRCPRTSAAAPSPRRACREQVDAPDAARRAPRSRRPRSRRRRGRRRCGRSARATGRAAPSSSVSVRSTSLAPAGFLTSRIDTWRPPIGIVSTRPNAPPKPSSASPTVASGTPSSSAVAAAADGVVDVVEAGERELELERRPAGVRSVDARAAHAVERHARGRHLRLRPLAAAVRAAVAAHVAEVDRPRSRRRGRSCGSASSRRRAACPGSACESSSTPK